jgi:hypothetical protein
MVPFTCQCSEEALDGAKKSALREAQLKYRGRKRLSVLPDPGNPGLISVQTTRSRTQPAEHCLRLLTNDTTAVFSSSVEIDVIVSCRVVRSEHLLEFLFCVACAAKILICRK